MHFNVLEYISMSTNYVLRNLFAYNNIANNVSLIALRSTHIFIEIEARKFGQYRRLIHL